jgi:Co/Zn/Cd efflux system component
MLSTSVALILESNEHKNDVNKVIIKDNIHLVACASFLVNLVNVLTVHRVKSDLKKENKKMAVGKRPAELADLTISSDHLMDRAKDRMAAGDTHDSEVLRPSSTDSTVITRIDKNEESIYHSKASQDAIFITFVHLFFDMALRLSVVLSTVMIKYFDYDAFDYYCSFFIAAVMAVTVGPLFFRTVQNMKKLPYGFEDLVADLTAEEAKWLKRNVMEIHEGKKRLLLIHGESHLKPRVTEQRAIDFCRKHGLEKLIWEENKGK